MFVLVCSFNIFCFRVVTKCMISVSCIYLPLVQYTYTFLTQASPNKAGEELNKQFASALILFDCVYSCLYYMLSDEINMFKLNKATKGHLRNP